MMNLKSVLPSILGEARYKVLVERLEEVCIDVWNKAELITVMSPYLQPSWTVMPFAILCLCEESYLLTMLVINTYKMLIDFGVILDPPF
jgi:hypothetical protein